MFELRFDLKIYLNNMMECSTANFLLLNDVTHNFVTTIIFRGVPFDIYCVTRNIHDLKILRNTRYIYKRSMPIIRPTIFTIFLILIFRCSFYDCSYSTLIEISRRLWKIESIFKLNYIFLKILYSSN